MVLRPGSTATRSLARLAIVAATVVSVGQLVDLLRAASQIHDYQDSDNEAGLATWNYHFGAVQLGAGLVALALLAAALVAVKVSRRFALAATFVAMAVSLVVVIGIQHGRALSDQSSDPSWTMRACAVALGVEAVLALALGARITWRRHV